MIDDRSDQTQVSPGKKAETILKFLFLIYKSANIFFLPEHLQTIALNPSVQTGFIGRLHLLHSACKAKTGKF